MHIQNMHVQNMHIQNMHIQNTKHIQNYKNIYKKISKYVIKIYYSYKKFYLIINTKKLLIELIH